MKSNKQSHRHLLLHLPYIWADEIKVIFLMPQGCFSLWFFFTSNIFHIINLLKNLNICESFTCFTDLFSGLCQIAHFLMCLINAFWCFISAIFSFLQGPPWNLFYLRKLFLHAVVCGFWLFLVFRGFFFSFRHYLRICFFIREKTELWMGLWVWALLDFVESDSGILDWDDL